MKVKELATSYLETLLRLKEKRRFIDYDLASHLKVLEQNSNAVEGKLAILQFKGEINANEELYSQYIAELNVIEAELKPMLIELNATRLDPLRVQANGRTHFDTFIDEKGDIKSPGYFTLLN